LEGEQRVCCSILIGKFDQLGSSAVRFKVLNNGSDLTAREVFTG
jgi:hypothetical protein